MDLSKHVESCGPLVIPVDLGGSGSIIFNSILMIVNFS